MQKLLSNLSVKACLVAALCLLASACVHEQAIEPKRTPEAPPSIATGSIPTQSAYGDTWGEIPAPAFGGEMIAGPEKQEGFVAADEQLAAASRSIKAGEAPVPSATVTEQKDETAKVKNAFDKPTDVLDLSKDKRKPATGKENGGIGNHKGRVVLNFDDADVYTIIQTIFGEVLKVNYVVDPRVKGRVTFRSVDPVPAEEVLPLMEVIFRLNGIGIILENGLYRIIPISEISKEPSPVSFGRDPAAIETSGKALLQVIPILYIQSGEAIKLISPFVTASAVIIDVPKSNQIIVADTDVNVRRILQLVAIFDNERLMQKTPQIHVYPVQNGKAKDVAAVLQQIFLGNRPASDKSSSRTAGQTASAQPVVTAVSDVLPQAPSAGGGGENLVSEITRIIPDEITNTITVLSTPEDYQLIKETIVQIDIPPRQVVIEGMIASVSLTDNLSVGISALFKAHSGGYTGNFALNPANLDVDPNSLSLNGFTFVATDVNGMVRSLITALATESKAKLLAAPHILVSDNREAKIQVGQQVPLVTSETYGSTVVAPQRTIQYRDIGIILKVKPRVNEGGLVALEMDQEVSTYSTITLF
ncbi:MAG: secretin N-terminal domain-containing protein, partial [Smithellaceae bacterium]|nr:secretin N-terminal domain-containing protein [Smithellaceae bacterium]